MACSTFLLESAGGLVVGHNLDHPGSVLGRIVVNGRNVEKESRSWRDLLHGEGTTPMVSWVSRYGSVAFLPFGRNFPDSGLNEAGLYIAEMTFEKSVYPWPDGARSIFVAEWIQYQLDLHATVDEVLSDLGHWHITGLPWHFFVADRSGQTAVVEFIAGLPVVHSGDAMPVKALCNDSYQSEIAALSKYEGFGGSLPIVLDDPSQPRFVHAAWMLANAGDRDEEGRIAYAIDIMRVLDIGGTRWSWLADLKTSKVFFFTDLSPELRFFDGSSFDFSCLAGPLALDVNAPLSGDVTANFAPFSLEDNRLFVQQLADALDQTVGLGAILRASGGSLETFIEVMAGQPEADRCLRRFPKFYRCCANLSR